jgi:3-dehydroquinate synthase
MAGSDITGSSDAPIHHVRVDLGARGYDVLVGRGILPRTGQALRRLDAGRRVVVVTHRTLASRFGVALRAGLESAGFQANVVVVPAGESSKSLRRTGLLIDAFSRMGLERGDTVVALGGGVIGDLAGFAAGIYMRGVRLVQAPTTLLAQIDSSIGGKTAVNHAGAKNRIGVYHQPALVAVDVDTLSSLPSRERRAGLAEAVKYGMILDGDLFERLEHDRTVLGMRRVGRELEDVVLRCIGLKARVVEADEFERGPREVLNYGHTVGHAVEATFARRLVHGEAIAIGMRVEARLAARLGLLDASGADRQDALLAGLGLPVAVPQGAVEPVMEVMRLDKKVRSGRIRCTLPEGIGRTRLGVEIDDALMLEVVRACQESS